MEKCNKIIYSSDNLNLTAEIAKQAIIHAPTIIRFFGFEKTGFDSKAIPPYATAADFSYLLIKFFCLDEIFLHVPNDTFFVENIKQ